MVEGETEYRPVPINYRRQVNSPLWAIAAFLAVKKGVTFNKLIDYLIMKEYSEVTKNG